MVNIKDGQIKPLDDPIKKDIKVGNDGRQFIIRLPTKISDNSILHDFKKKYKANIKLKIKKPNEIIIELKEDG